MSDDAYRFTIRCYPGSVMYHRWRGPGELLMVVCDRRWSEPLTARVDGGDPGDEDEAR